MFKVLYMENRNLMNEEINKMRKMMGLNEGWDNDDYVDDISSAKSSAKRQYDFYQDAIEYVGGEEEWNKLTQDEKDSVINDMERDFDRSRSLGESNDNIINPNYTHFAILNSNNKIASGWEYASDLDRSDIIYYVKFDMDDMDYKPSEYKIRTAESLKNNGIDPFDPENWDKYNN